jgi:hypothetical protein
MLDLVAWFVLSSDCVVVTGDVGKRMDLRRVWAEDEEEQEKRDCINVDRLEIDLV